MSGKIRFLWLVTLLVLLGAVLLFGIPGWAQKAKPPTPPPDPAIAYVAQKGWAHTKLMVMNADGSNQNVLVDGTKANYSGNHNPNWSPDSNWIVFGRTFDSTCCADNRISMIKKDGSGLCNLVASAPCPAFGFGGDPRWSPYPVYDMPRILYFEIDPSDIFLANAACPANTIVNLPYPLSHPTWARSPVLENGVEKYRFAAFAEDPPATGDNDIIIYDLSFDSSQGWKVTEIANLTDAGPLENVDFLDMDWARLSDSLVVTVWIRGENKPDIWVLHLDDPARPINITNTPFLDERAPSWSPLDTQIVFEVRELKNGGIYVMNADGSNVKKLAASASNVMLRAPDWRRNP